MAETTVRQRGTTTTNPASKPTVRQPVNSFEKHLLSPNESILNSIFNIYTNKDDGKFFFGFCLII